MRCHRLHTPTFFLVVGALACWAGAAPAAEPGLLQPREVRDELAGEILAAAVESMRATVEKRPPKYALSAASRLYSVRNGVHVTLLRKGRILGEGMARQASLIGNLRLAGARAAASLEYAEILDGSAVLVTVLFEPRPLGAPPVPTTLKRHAKPGVDGYFATYKGLSHTMAPLIPILRGEREQEILTRLVEKLSPPPAGIKPGGREETRRVLGILASRSFHLSLMPGVTLARLPEGTGHVLTRLRLPVDIHDVSEPRVQQGFSAAVGWATANQTSDGSLLGAYDPVLATPKEDASPESLAFAVLGLGAAWKQDSSQKTRAAGLACLQFALREHARKDEQERMGYLATARRPLPAATAALVVGAIRLNALSDVPEAAEYLPAMGRYLQSLRREDGRYDPAALRAGPSTAEGDAGAGLVQLALTEWALTHSDTALLTKLEKSALLYKRIFENKPTASLTPWHILACVRMQSATANQALTAFVKQMSDMLTTSQELPTRDLTDTAGRFQDAGAPAPTPLEADACALRIAALAQARTFVQRSGDALRASTYRHAILWGTRYLLQQQVMTDVDLLLVPDPERARGGVRTEPAHPRLRLSDSAMALDAFAAVLDTLTVADYSATGILER